ncbi:hypothetical protein KAH94_04835 [bacterium]|nr:hypothetical protein [bacterium]
MKNQKVFTQISLLITIFLVVLLGVEVVTPIVTGAVTFDTTRLLYPIRYPSDGPNPETGCRGYGDDARIEYEQCQQAYYLQKQAELLESQQASREILAEEQQAIKELEVKNKEFQDLLEEQNKQVNILSASLKNVNSLNIGLSIISGVFLICLILFFYREKKKKI